MGRSPFSTLKRRRLGLLLAAVAAVTVLLHSRTAVPRPVSAPTYTPEDPDGRSYVQTRYREDAGALARLMATWPADKPRAAIFILARNVEAVGVVQSLRQLEATFNGNASAMYPCAWCWSSAGPWHEHERRSAGSDGVVDG